MRAPASAILAAAVTTKGAAAIENRHTARTNWYAPSSTTDAASAALNKRSENSPACASDSPVMADTRYGSPIDSMTPEVTTALSAITASVAASTAGRWSIT